MKPFFRILYFTSAAALVLATTAFFGALGAYYYLAPTLPDVETLREVRLQVPLRIYSRDGRLIAEYGEQRRLPMRFEEFPERVVEAFLAAEDDRFFEHPGVDYQGLSRAILYLLLTGERRQGGGTITMQLARNFFLSPEKTYVRKLKEIFLALRIERELSKREILTLYLNKIFLGQRAYGVAAAAEVYYGKSVDALGLAEIATIAGLPKAPSRDNPITSPERARDRRAYVLRRMLELDYISAEEAGLALAAAAPASLHGPTVEVDAPYLAEMVRLDMLNRFGRAAYTDGYEVVTTLDSRLQRSAVRALRQALLEYDRRHGYRGPVARAPEVIEQGPAAWAALLEAYSEPAELALALVVEVGERDARALLRDGREVTIGWSGLAWARPYVDENNLGAAPDGAADVVSPGDVVRIVEIEGGSWQLAQLPEAQGALVAVDPKDGAVVALSGGYDYYLSKYNRAVQARRQPGSSFKPFIYSAAFDQGFTAASIINDAPVVFEDAELEGTWRPENYSGRFYGPTRLREALIRSRNMVSIRLLREIGLGSTLDYLQRFGFAPGDLPRDLSLALGSAVLSPLRLAEAYTVFANGGFRTEAYYIDSIRQANGETIFAADPAIVCLACEVESDAEQGQAEAPDDALAGLFAAGDGADASADVDTTAPTAMIDRGLETLLVADGTRQDRDLLKLAPRVISDQNAYLITNLMRDVVRRGTGQRAYRELRRRDLAGKTGTTNDRRDAWFSGFTPDLVATAWVGFDQERSLGRQEEGGRTALPMWIYFMRDALAGLPETKPQRPSGLVTVKISPDTGLLAAAGDQDAIFETFRIDQVPDPDTPESVYLPPRDREEDDDDSEPLF